VALKEPGNHGPLREEPGKIEELIKLALIRCACSCAIEANRDALLPSFSNNNYDLRETDSSRYVQYFGNNAP